MAEFVPAIGLEVHVELATRTKIWCGCEAAFGGEPNTRCCPVCAGLPGALPVLSREAVALAVRTGLAFGSEIAETTAFARKNYGYPDLAKGYQITQDVAPICTGGALTLDLPRGKKTVRIARIHLEEDAGKLVRVSDGTLVDFNRAGVPLVEIVTEPDMADADEAVAFVRAVRRALVWIGVSDGKMQEGSLRCDVNVSLAPDGAPLGTRTEHKNLASVRAVGRAIRAEIARQSAILRSGGRVERATLGWDDEKGESRVMRAKEEERDYRYFTEPDLPPVRIDRAFVAAQAALLPVMPEERAARYVSDFGLSRRDAEVLTADRAVSDLFEACVACGNVAPKAVSDFLRSEVLRLRDGSQRIPPSAAQIVDILRALAEKKLNRNGARTVLAALWASPAEDVRTLVGRLGLAPVSDEAELERLAADLLASMPKACAEYRAGKTKVRERFVGEIMRATDGRADPSAVVRILEKLLGSS